MNMNLRTVFITKHGENGSRIFQDGKTHYFIRCAFETKICSPDCASCYNDEIVNGEGEFRPFVAAHCSRLPNHFQTIGEITNFPEK